MFLLLQVAFYEGNSRERLTILASFSKLTDHLRKFLEFRVGMGVIDNLIAKCNKSEQACNLLESTL